jgi:hypothetical protein
MAVTSATRLIKPATHVGPFARLFNPIPYPHRLKTAGLYADLPEWPNGLMKY